MRRICVYCGSRTGNRPVYGQAAKALGRLLADRGLELVYGGGGIGMMGLLADSVLEAGGRAVGIIPRDLMEREVGHDGLTELHVVETLHQRKAQMAELADAFVAFPGGLGTMEEILEIAAWAQLRLHAKPMGLLNVEGYFDPFVQFLDHAVGEGFIKHQNRRRFLVDADADALLDRLIAAAPAGEPAAGAE